MSSFPEWASQFFNAVNLFKPIEEQACQTALVLMKERASEMVQQLTATAPKDFKLLMIRLDEIFNPSGNQQVALALFETFVQKEDMTIQEYAHEIESLYRRAYPSLNVTQSGHLMFRFINGLLNDPLRVKLRSPPVASNFRALVNSAMTHTAAMFPDHQLCRNKSSLYKAAVFRGNLTQRKRESVNAIASIPEEPESIAVFKKKTWKCTYHKSNNHSNSECREQKAQKEFSQSRREPKRKFKSKSRRRDRVKRKIKDKSSSRKSRTKKRKRKSRKIHEMREGSTDSSSESDKSTSTSGSTSSDESDTDESPQIEYFDNFILALEMDTSSSSPDIDKEIEEFLSNLPYHDKEEEQATSSSLSVLGAALAEAMDTDVTEPVNPSSNRPTAVEVIELPESSTQSNAETSSFKDLTKVPAKPSTEVTITTGDTITFIPALSSANRTPLPKLSRFDPKSSAKEHIQFAKEVLKHSSDYDPIKVLREPSEFYNTFHQDVALRQDRLEQAASIVKAGNFAATRYKTKLFTAYLTETKAHINKALLHCNHTIYDACEMAFKLGGTELVEQVVRGSLRPMIHLAEAAFSEEKCSSCITVDNEDPSLNLRKENYRRAANGAATITGLQLKPLGDRTARQILDILTLPQWGIEGNLYDLDYTSYDVLEMRKLHPIDQRSFQDTVDRLANFKELPCLALRDRSAIRRAPLNLHSMDNNTRRHATQTRKDAVLSASQEALRYYQYRSQHLMAKFGATHYSAHYE